MPKNSIVWSIAEGIQIIVVSDFSVKDGDHKPVPVHPLQSLLEHRRRKASLQEDASICTQQCTMW